MTIRKSIDEPFEQPVMLPEPVNLPSSVDCNPCLLFDGSTLYFVSNRPGGLGGWDIWQASIEPIVDLNGDGIVNADDMCMVVDSWGTDDSLCDIGPMPWGDGIVDVQDLVVLAEHLFEEISTVEPAEPVE
jgi:hypothetical protein